MYKKILIFSLICLSTFSCMKDNRSNRLSGVLNLNTLKFSPNDASGDKETNTRADANKVKIDPNYSDNIVSLQKSGSLAALVQTNTMKSDTQTRGTLINNKNINDYTTAVYIYSFNGDWNENIKPAYQDKNLKYSAKDGYSFAEDAYWPSLGSNIRFFAYCPKIARTDANTAFVETAVDNSKKSNIKLHVSVDKNVLNQKDVLVAYTEPEKVTDMSKVVPLNMKHIMSGLKFYANSNMLNSKLMSIKIKGLVREAKYNSLTNDWSDFVPYRSSSDEIVMDFNDGIDVSAPTESQSEKLILPENQTLYLIPQKISDNTMIEIRMIYDGIDHTFTLQLNKLVKELKQGLITKITLGNKKSFEWHTVFDVKLANNSDTISFKQDGGASAFIIKSYKHNKLGNIVPIRWRAKFNYNISAVASTNRVPFMFDNITAYGYGTNENAVRYPFSVGSYTPDALSSYTMRQIERHREKFQYTPPPKESDNNFQIFDDSPKDYKIQAYNLSNSKGEAKIENTANCYIVNTYGVYKIPLVFGNGIKNGKINGLAFSNAYPISNFKIRERTFPFLYDYSSIQITDPYILTKYSDQKYQLKAKVIWEDSQNLITNLKFDSFNIDDFNGYGGIQFEIKRSNIIAGNAIIALFDKNGTIVWSWHIWVTDLDPNTKDGNTYITSQGKKYKLLGRELGYTDAYYQGNIINPKLGRKVRIQFEQAPVDGAMSLKSTTFKVTCKGILQSRGANALYYQWGRKDPILQFDGSHYDNVSTANQRHYTIFNSDGTVNYDQASTADPGKRDLGITDYDQPPLIDGYNWMGHMIAMSIRHPIEFNSNDYDSGKNYYANLWNNCNMNNFNDAGSDYNTKVGKTIYDPCPVGYHVPCMKTFQDIDTVFNASGYQIKIKMKDKKSFFYILGVGYRDNNGKLRDIDKENLKAYYWISDGMYHYTKLFHDDYYTNNGGFLYANIRKTDKFGTYNLHSSFWEDGWTKNNSMMIRPVAEDDNN